MVSKPDPEIDARLTEILHNVKQIDLFMDAIFSFLYRRTDFYHIMQSQSDAMGLPPGAARKLIMQTYLKYEQLKHGVPTLTSETNIPEPVSTVEIGTSQQTSSESTVNESDKEPTTEKKKPDNHAQPTNTTKNQTPRGVSSKSLSHADTYNGAMCEKYWWSQTLKDIDIKIAVPQCIKKAKQLEVDIQNTKIRVVVKPMEANGSPDILVDGKLKAQIRTDESMWSLIPGDYVQLSLEKRLETWWHAALEGEPEIDPKSINNSQTMDELDEDDKQGFRQAMFDYDQKQQGKPTSKELSAHEMLKKAWDVEGSPFKGQKYDPSVVNIATG